MSKFDPEYKCQKCGGRITWEHDGGDFKIDPCQNCKDDAYSEGYSNGYDEGVHDAEQMFRE